MVARTGVANGAGSKPSDNLKVLTIFYLFVFFYMFQAMLLSFVYIIYFI